MNPAAKLRQHMPVHFLLAIIIALGICLSLAFFYGPSWINGSDNYIYTSQAYLLAQGHANQLNCNIVDCVNYIVIAGVAFFLALLGYGSLAASLFGVLCLSLTVVVIYLIGKELYGPKAGLISAFFYSILPVVISQSSNVGDDIPMALLMSVSVLLLIHAIKKQTINKRCMLLVGFVSTLNLLTVSEAIIGVFFIGTFLVLLSLSRKSRDSVYGIGIFIVGALIAFSVIALVGMYEAHNPFYVLNVYIQNYSTYIDTPAFGSYISDIFPTGMNNSLGALSFGYFGYLFAVCGLYLLYAGFRKGAVIGYWFAFSLLYLGFGTLSLSRYDPVLYTGARVALIFVPAMTLIAGIALAMAIDKFGRRKSGMRTLACAVIAAAAVIVIASCILNDMYINYSQLDATEPLLQFGQYLNSLPPSTNVYGPSDVPWDAYMNQGRKNITINGYAWQQTNCTDVDSFYSFKPGSFFVGNVSDPQSCHLYAVYTPRQIGWLGKYALFDDHNWGLDFYSYRIYEYNPVNASP